MRLNKTILKHQLFLAEDGLKQNKNKEDIIILLEFIKKKMNESDYSETNVDNIINHIKTNSIIDFDFIDFEINEIEKELQRLI